jgi:large subunit ribosomal protein L17
MRHTMRHRKFNRSTNQRKALLSCLAGSLVEHESVITTLPKAKDLRPFVEKIITLSRNEDKTAAFRNIYKKVRSQKVTHKVLSDLSPRTEKRPGGYLRIIKAGFRSGDKAPMALIEFVDKKVDKKVLKNQDKKAPSLS